MKRTHIEILMNKKKLQTTQIAAQLNKIIPIIQSKQKRQLEKNKQFRMILDKHEQAKKSKQLIMIQDKHEQAKKSKQLIMILDTQHKHPKILPIAILFYLQLKK